LSRTPRQAASAALLELTVGPRHLDAVLKQQLDALPPGRGRSTAANLVYGVLRERARLDYLIERFCDKPLAKLDGPVLAVLRLGAAELCLLEAPAYAVVDAYVRLAKAGPAGRASGLINAVLRKLAQGWAKTPFPPPDAPLPRRLSLAYSHPRWLVEELLAQWSPEEVEAWLASRQGRAPLVIRVNRLAAEPGQAAELLRPAVEDVSTHPFSPDALALSGVQGPPAELPGFAQGLWAVQDAGAQAVSLMLDVSPGMRVLDLCAGAGGKTGHLAAIMQNQGELWAVEPSAGRARALRDNLKRLRVTNARVKQQDGLTLDQAACGLFDRVLVDAPCSGLGTTGRRPDLRFRRRPREIEEIAGLQERLLEQAFRLVAPGGRVLYVTCTVTRRENQEVAAKVAGSQGAGLEWPQGLAPELAGLVGGDGYWRSFPQPAGADGFFAAGFTLPF